MVEEVGLCPIEKCNNLAERFRTHPTVRRALGKTCCLLVGANYAPGTTVSVSAYRQGVGEILDRMPSWLFPGER